ncbi:MAG: tRNA (guanosine(37)-N1)-methyltransferase TrmD [Rhodothermales bacterium]|nr:tRNA (guanosine(37)-N1)-methyltransferase TrmD [Rhodothermales bacterium]
MLRIDLITAHPGLVQSPLEHSILRRAQQKGLVDVRVHDLRRFGEGKHRKVDDYPFGGQGGMVLTPGPLFAAVEAVQAEWGAEADGGAVDGEVVYLTPDGEPLSQPLANAFSIKSHLLLIAGHYKGIDQRVRDTVVTREVSIGDYVLSGGELPALVLVDAVARLVPGVLGDAQSALSDSFQDGLLDAPVYTRPAEFRGMPVPDALRSGDHARVLQWREEQRLQRTRERRPDLLH